MSRGLGWAGALLLLWASAAQGQVIERHAPPAPSAPVVEAPPPPPPQEVADDRPLGPTLRGVILLGGRSPTSLEARAGVSFAPGFEAPPHLDLHRLEAFVGRPLSRRLISEVQIAVVQAYRAAHRPFVEVSTPEQDLSGGTLQVRVIEFRLGRIVATGASRAEDLRVARAFQLQPGAPIDERRLNQDLDWLARDPYRVVTPVFAPGREFGETDLAVGVVQIRPWTATAGYDDSGERATGRARYYLGGSAAFAALNDAQASFQVTGDRTFWSQAPRGPRHSPYESVAARLSLPTWSRQEIDVDLDAVESNEPVEAFTVRQQTLEASLGYRAALSNWTPLPGDVEAGVEAKRQRRLTFFGDFEILRAEDATYQGFIRWSDRWSDALGRTGLEIGAHWSAGGLDDRSSGAALAEFTGGRVASARYQYLTLSGSRANRLPRGLELDSELTAQAAGGPLPDTEQLPMGGPSAVRGYGLEDGAFDQAVILRNELRPTQAFRIGTAKVGTALAPFILLDAGYGQSRSGFGHASIAGLGLGADVAAGLLHGRLSLSRALAGAAVTHAGDWRLDVRLALAY